MTQRAAIAGALLLILLAIAVNTFLVLYVTAERHSTASQRFVSIEQDLSQIKREGR